MFMTKLTIPIWNAYLKSPHGRLPKGLSATSNSKFVQMYDCMFLDTMLPLNWRPIYPEKDGWDDMPLSLRCFSADRTGIERIVSKIHIGDFVKGKQIGIERDILHFRNAFNFLVGVIALFSKQYSDKVLRGIISMDDGCEPDYCYSCCVYYHVKRDGESWLHDDLEVYNDGKIFVIDSDDPYFGAEK